MAMLNTTSSPASNQKLRKLADGSVPAPLPDNEARRLADLQMSCILDTANDARFDRIAKLAADLLDVPIVLVSLVDAARQWFKATVGTDIVEIRRDHGFCTHGLLQPGPQAFTVTDALTDHRFQTHPFVVGGPQLRFYSGAPMITENGNKIGMLCVHDFKPRPDFGARQEAILAKLAAITMDEINFHRHEVERQMLTSELSHRIKNVFAMIRSIARLSGRHHPEATGFLTSFSQRMDAMAAAHDQLFQNNWRSTSLEAIFRSVIAAYQDVDGSRFRVSLPDALVNPDFAQSFALAIHELLTNAIKYGALSHGEGHVEFEGHGTDAQQDHRFIFTWRETGGPPPKKPAGSGFGHQMLAQLVQFRGGTVRIDWLKQGLVCHFEL